MKTTYCVLYVRALAVHKILITEDYAEAIRTYIHHVSEISIQFKFAPKEVQEREAKSVSHRIVNDGFISLERVNHK